MLLARGLALSLLFFVFHGLAAQHSGPHHDSELELQVDYERTERADVDTACRASDLECAFNAMMEMNPDRKMFVVVKGRSIDNLVGVEATPNGTMVILTIARRRGLEQMVVKAEDIDKIGERGPVRCHSPVRIPCSWP